MAVNLAAKYSPVVDERFYNESVTRIAFNQDYDWVGVKTVNVYSIQTSPMNDYTRTGLARYGTPAELQDNIQELTLRKDRSFTYTIDLGNNIDQLNIKGAGTALDRQLREVVIPEVDTYRLAMIAAGAGGSDDTEADASNAYELFLKAQEFMGNNKVPVAGRVAFMTYGYFNFLKLDPSFVQSGDMAEISLTRGVMGAVDGVPLIPVASSYLPADTQFILIHPIAATAPVKLSEYTLHDNPPGISGNLTEGRAYYDCFVLNSKKNGIYVSTSA